MNILGAILGWLVVCGFLWLAALALIGAVLRVDGVLALFSILFGVLALVLARQLTRESGLNA